MTEEQIAKLEGLTHGCSMGLPPCECDIPEALGDHSTISRQIAPLPVLQRLLEERKRLLAFARRMDETLDRHLYQPELAECAAAIAFAEEAAP